MTRYALYLGCVVPVQNMNTELAARRVAERLEIEMVDVEGFSCCGFVTKQIDWKASLLMAARNLALAEAQGLDVLTLCSTCTGTLSEASHLLREDNTLRDWVNEELSDLGYSYRGTVRVRHFAQMLFEKVGIVTVGGYVPRSLEAQMDELNKHGRLYEIGDWENERRASCGLPPIYEQEVDLPQVLERTRREGKSL